MSENAESEHTEAVSDRHGRQHFAHECSKQSALTGCVAVVSLDLPTSRHARAHLKSTRARRARTPCSTCGG